MSAWADVAAITAKDLRIEWRARHAGSVIVPFVVTLVVTAGLAFGPGISLLRQTAPGLIWLTGLFAVVLAARHAYEVESADDAVTGLLLAPIDKAAVFAGKANALGAQLVVLQAAVIGLVGLLYGLPPGSSAPALAVTVVLGALGLGAMGSLLGAVAGAPRTQGSVLPLLVFPLAAPLLLAVTGATAGAFRGVFAVQWLSLLAAFDVVFWSLGILLYGATLED